MPAYRKLEGVELVELRELVCSCGQPPHHVLARLVKIRNNAGAFGVQMRGWCVDHSPVVAQVYPSDREAPKPQRWWERLIQ